MIQIIKMIYITLISLITTNNKSPKPKYDLHKQNEKPKKRNIKIDLKVIGKIIGILLLLMLIVFVIYYIYKTGCLESTNYYYRMDKI